MIPAPSLLQWVRGVAPISRMPMGNHCLVRTPVVADHADMPPIARASMRETSRPLPDGLQSAWAAQRDASRLVGVGYPGPMTRDIREVTLRAAYLMADEMQVPRPPCITPRQE